MGLFSKVFSSAKREEPQTQMKRAPRLRLIPLHGVSLRLEGHPADPMGVSNLSVGGIGILKEEGRSYPAPGTVIRGSLDVSGVESPVTIRVLYDSGSVVGCQFLEVGADFREKIVRHFSNEFAAIRMTAVKPEMLQEEPDGAPGLFVGEKGTELHYVLRDGRLVRFYLSFFGNFIEGGEGGLRSGFLEEERGAGKPGYGGPAFVKGEAGVPADLAATTVKFLVNIEKLDPGVRRAIVELLGQH